MGWRWLLAVLVSGVLVVACGPKGGKTPSPAPVVTPSPSPSPVASPSPTGTASPTSAPNQGSEQEVRDYLARVFPAGPGRDEVFFTCTGCHGIQVIVLAGPLKDRSAWEMTRHRHETAGGVQVAPLPGGQAEQDLIWEYLIQNFGPDKPPPPPPPESLLIGWQSYI